MKKILIILLIGVSVLILPKTVLGAVSSLEDLVENIRVAINAAAGGIVIISWIIVAVLFLITLGNPEKFNIAKKALIWTIIGTAIYLLGNVVFYIIKEAVLG